MSSASELRLQKLMDYLAKDPNDSFSRYAIALEWLKQGKKEDAVLYFEELLKRDPNYVGTYYQLGKIYVAEKKDELAKQTYKKGIEIATSLQNLHAKSELQSALNELMYGDDF